MKVINTNYGLTIDLVRKLWSVILSKLKEKDLAAQAFAVEGKPVSVSDNTITVEYPEYRGFHVKGAKQKKEIITEVIEKVLLKEIGYEKINLEIKLEEG